jgi:uncharacterized protein (DUF58 family)
MDGTRSRTVVDPRVLATLEGLELRARYVMEGFLAGRHGSPFHGLSVEFRDYRDYQPGDDLRRLDWRLFARSDRLCVKRYEQETNARCYILCDTSASMGYRGKRAWASKFEAARVVSLALGWLMLNQNDAVGMLALEPADRITFIPPAQVPHQVGVLLRTLEGLEPHGGPVLASLLDHAARMAHRRSVVLLVSDLLDPAADVADGLRRLRFYGHDILVVQVLDADEVDFPFTDGELEDLETGQRRAVSRSARETYRARFEAFMDEHQRLFTELEATHAVVRTDGDPGRALARALSRRSAA